MYSKKADGHHERLVHQAPDAIFTSHEKPSAPKGGRGGVSGKYLLAVTSRQYTTYAKQRNTPSLKP